MEDSSFAALLVALVLGPLTLIIGGCLVGSELMNLFVEVILEDVLEVKMGGSGWVNGWIHQEQKNLFSKKQVQPRFSKHSIFDCNWFLKPSRNGVPWYAILGGKKFWEKKNQNLHQTLQKKT